MRRLKRVGCLLSKRRTQPRLPRPPRRWEGVVRVYETKENLWPTLRINTRKTCPESFTSMTSALTATCAGKPHPLISGAATTAATPMCLSNRPPQRRRRFARKPWKDVRSKPSATMAKAECDRTKPTKHYGKKTSQDSSDQGRATRPSGCVHNRRPENSPLQCGGNLPCHRRHLHAPWRTAVGRRRSRHQGHLSVARCGFRPENRRCSGAASAEGRSKLQSRGRRR